MTKELKAQELDHPEIELNESMLCVNCGEPHYLQIDDAGSDREVERLCDKCFNRLRTNI